MKKLLVVLLMFVAVSAFAEITITEEQERGVLGELGLDCTSEINFGHVIMVTVQFQLTRAMAVGGGVDEETLAEFDAVVDTVLGFLSYHAERNRRNRE